MLSDEFPWDGFLDICHFTLFFSLSPPVFLHVPYCLSPCPTHLLLVPFFPDNYTPIDCTLFITIRVAPLSSL